ncbi:hypothetical protein CC85DRAFT_285051 [Cutaneotrichosporon oleaginosum]|uniref:BTB domain-containing protein n=1 Tax=Cutaneotrichosporon oleaginosum TaxID=879819 RepID=A0A0J0XP68_9TREE|nr:uncharacterized protein CC85DRAFT_285051 [Cutaneotrichosporon oleaginosum]KLT42901.1 hypothetical protein CC85DRAFT_285051 [Cutaneotrichosporon oleaginosum]TXT12605.1 hypothetical protein COLE_03015 [Cutaneotrichosporon oleaginosum]
MSATPVSSDPNWTDGNFVITSSDGVKFKVKEYNLYWASPVFAEAHSRNFSGKEIELTDPELETAAILRLFLTVITTLHLPMDQFKDGDLTTLTNFLFFLRKWDAKQLFPFVLEYIHAAVKGAKLSPLHVFQLGAQIDDVDTCLVALRHTAGYDPWWGPWWTAEDDYRPFNACGWSLRFYKEHKIPAVYLLALNQSMGHSPTHPDGWFKEYLERAKKEEREWANRAW